MFKLKQYAGYIHVVNNNKLNKQKIGCEQVLYKAGQTAASHAKKVEPGTHGVFVHLSCRGLSMDGTISKLTAISPVHGTHLYISPWDFLLVPGKELAI